MKIKYKLVSIIFLILTVSLIPLAWLAIVTSQEIIVENAYALSDNLSEIISNVAKEELFINTTYEGTNRVINEMDISSIRGLKNIDIINVDGIFVEGSNDLNKGKKISATEMNYLKGIKKLSYRELEYNSKKVLRFSYPIFIDHEEGQLKIGAALFDFDKKELFYHVEKIQRQITIYCLIIILISVLFTFFISGYFTKPLKILKEGVDTIRTGNLEHQININSKDEIGELAEDFNKMAVALKKMDELKNDFLSNTSHELKTPLNGIIGIAESLHDGVSGQLSKSAKANLSLIISSGKRLNSLVNDILDFSKLKHKELQIHLQPVDIHSITILILKLSEPLIKGKKLKLINEIPATIPAILADENRMQQILYNLIGNAIKFTNEGEVKISAELIEKDIKKNISSQNLLKVIISDTGIGIPKDKLQAIFESFEQVDTSNAREYGGTGLGLSVTKQLLELQSGNIYVESEFGKGSRFIFTIPVTSELPQRNETSSIAEIVSSIEDDLPDFVPVNLEEGAFNENGDLRRTNHILVVDDEPINVQVISNHFTLRGYKVSTAASGKEALNFLEFEKPDIVLLDVMMPIMTGFEVSQKIREQYDMNELPVLFLTAKNRSSDLQAGFKAEGNDYIVKPFSKEELISRVGVHIKLKEKTEQLIEYNQNLELKVEERTHALEEAKSEVVELNELVQNLNSVSDLSKVMEFLVYYLEDKYNYTDYFLWLVDSEKNEFYNGWSMSNVLSNDIIVEIQQIRIPVIESSGSLYATYKIQKPVYIPVNTDESNSSFDQEIIDKGNFRYFFQIPLVIYGDVIGILCLHKARDIFEISNEEQLKLEKLSGQIAGSIQNSNLYKVSQEATALAEKEHIKSEKLLLNILPEEVAKELKEKGIVTPVVFDSTSIMFTDFKGFTKIAERLEPQDLLKELDGCFSQFDKIIERNNLEKLKTIGDAYMCGGGIPKVNSTHPIDSCLAAIEIQAFMTQMKEIKQYMDIPYWELRLGIHTGPVIAGVVGEKKFTYDIWGDTVNTASRMESSGSPGRINISYATYEYIKELFDCEYRGEIDAKNKGKVKMYYLSRIKEEFSQDEDGHTPNDLFWEIYSKVTKEKLH